MFQKLVILRKLKSDGHVTLFSVAAILQKKFSVSSVASLPI